MNWMVAPTAGLAAALYVAGRWLARRARPRGAVALALGAAAASMPAVLFAAYYTHRLDGAAWLYEFRSWPYTELTAAGIGMLAGLVDGWQRAFLARRVSRGLRLFLSVAICVGAAAVLAVPYAKWVIVPLAPDLRDTWQAGVCIQTAPSTCGPASLATLLAARGMRATEAELAHECHTCGSGTENWFLARAARRRGLQVSYVLLDEEPASVPYPSVAGTGFGGRGGAGHYVAILGKEGDRYVVGDPMAGRSVLTPELLRRRYFLTGFFMVVR